MITCLRCGKCCIIFDYIKRKWIDCPYLDQKTKLCTIYKKRLGTYLGFGFVCGLRKNTVYDFPDCPYNSDKPMHPNFR